MTHMTHNDLRRLAPVLALVFCLPLGGCFILAGGAAAGAGVAVATAPERPTASRWRPDDAVSVDFAPRREIAAAVPMQRDSLRVSRVTRLVGRVRRVQADTLWIAASELKRDAERMTFARGREPLAVVVPDGSARVQVLAIQLSREQRGVLGALLGAGVTLLALYGYCAATRCID